MKSPALVLYLSQNAGAVSPESGTVRVQFLLNLAT